MIIAVDFDGTLCDFAFPEIGNVLPVHQKVINFLQEQKRNGHSIILLTCREDLPHRAYLTEAIEWCKQNNIPIDFVNENANTFQEGLMKGFAKRKIHADIYIDDRAINPLNL